jgi:hypothetical protein
MNYDEVPSCSGTQIRTYETLLWERKIRRLKRQRDLQERLELARNNVQAYLKKYGSLYFGRL